MLFTSRWFDLNTRCTTLEHTLETVQQQLSNVMTAPPTPQTPIKLWHQQDNIMGVKHSRCAPNHPFDCTHVHNCNGCRWCNRRVALQAYVLYLTTHHAQDVDRNFLLPVPSWDAVKCFTCAWSLSTIGCMFSTAHVNYTKLSFTYSWPNL